MKSKITKLIALGMTVVLPQLAVKLDAQVVQSQAKVHLVKGDARFRSGNNAKSKPIKVNQKLLAGDTVECGKGSEVSLFFSDIGSLVKVAESTTLSLDKLNLSEFANETAVEVVLNLKSGTIQGQVKKLAATSRYEVRIPNGICSVRGTEYRINASGVVHLFSGAMRINYQPPGAQPITYDLKPGQVFHPPVAGGGAQIKEIDPNDPTWKETVSPGK